MTTITSSWRLHALAAMTGVALAACGGSDSSSDTSASRTIDSADTSAPAKLTTAEDTANVAASLRTVVDATAFGSSFGGSYGTPARAKARQTENCPDGGSVTYEFDEADFISPPFTVELDFMNCRDDTSLLDGVITTRCDNPNQDCSEGQVTFGQTNEAFLFEESTDTVRGLLIGRIDYEGAASDSDFTRTASRLSGQAESTATNAEFVFEIGDSSADFVSTQTRGSTSVALTVDGPYALAATAETADCASGKVVVDTLQPLTLSNDGDGPVIAGQLKFTNADGEMAFADFNSDGSVTVTGADGSQQTLTEADLEQRCELN